MPTYFLCSQKYCGVREFWEEHRLADGITLDQNRGWNEWAFNLHLHLYTPDLPEKGSNCCSPFIG